MKTQTTVGAQTLEAALVNHPQTRFLQIPREIAKSHHERWDGADYPEGLTIRRKRIPTTPSDVIDRKASTMTTKRVALNPRARSPSFAWKYPLLNRRYGGIG